MIDGARVRIVQKVRVQHDKYTQSVAGQGYGRCKMQSVVQGQQQHISYVIDRQTGREMGTLRDLSIKDGFKLADLGEIKRSCDLDIDSYGGDVILGIRLGRRTELLSLDRIINHTTGFFSLTTGQVSKDGLVLGLSFYDAAEVVSALRSLTGYRLAFPNETSARAIVGKFGHELSKNGIDRFVSAGKTIIESLLPIRTTKVTDPTKGVPGCGLVLIERPS